MDFTQALTQFIEQKIKEISVALPAVVTKTTPAKQTVEVRVMLKNEEAKTLLIPDVECWQFATSATNYLYNPIVAGTQGLLLCLDKNASNYFLGSSGTLPAIADNDRYHNLSDCVFIPGFVQQRLAVQPATTNTAEWRHGNMKVVLHPTGKIEIEGATKEMLTVIDSFMSHVITSLNNLVRDAHNGAATHAMAPAWAAGLFAQLVQDRVDFNTMAV